jgi:hypothetical protein
MAIAEYEDRYLDTYGYEFGAALAMARGKARVLSRCRIDHKHTSTVAHFNTTKNIFGREILIFAKSLFRRFAGGQVKIDHEEKRRADVARAFANSPSMWFAANCRSRGRGDLRTSLSIAAAVLLRLFLATSTSAPALV